MGEGMGPGTGRIHAAAAFFPLPSRSGLVEIRAVALRTVAIKGAHSVRYLCMGADGRMHGLVGVATRG